MKIKKLEKYAKKWGADFFGIADLKPAKPAIIAQGGELVADYPYAVSMGISLMDSIVDQLPKREQRAVAVNYRHHSYDIINIRLDILASQVGSLLQNKGYHALPVPASKRVDDEKICAIFSHKMAAHLAGLGWIGKSCLLITPDRGPRVRWGTVLTDAPLPADSPLEGKGCGGCKKCVVACPSQAFSGKAWKPSDAREERMDAKKCFEYLRVTRKQASGVPACGLCVYVCPFGSGRGKKKAGKSV